MKNHISKSSGFGVMAYILGFVVLLGIVTTIYSGQVRENKKSADNQITSGLLAQQADIIRITLRRCAAEALREGAPPARGSYPNYPGCQTFVDNNTANGTHNGQTNTDTAGSDTSGGSVGGTGSTTAVFGGETGRTGSTSSSAIRAETSSARGSSCSVDNETNALSADLPTVTCQDDRVFAGFNPDISLPSIIGFYPWKYHKISGDGVYASIIPIEKTEETTEAIRNARARFAPNELTEASKSASPVEFGIYIFRDPDNFQNVITGYTGGAPGNGPVVK